MVTDVRFYLGFFGGRGLLLLCGFWWVSMQFLGCCESESLILKLHSHGQ